MNQDPRDVWGVSTTAELFADYARVINLTNEHYHNDAFAHGALGWDEAFQYEIPKAVLVREITRMEAWIEAHRAEIATAQTNALFEEPDAEGWREEPS